jgi:hypothetical protein
MFVGLLVGSDKNEGTRFFGFFFAKLVPKALFIFSIVRVSVEPQIWDYCIYCCAKNL